MLGLAGRGKEEEGVRAKLVERWANFASFMRPAMKALGLLDMNAEAGRGDVRHAASYCYSLCPPIAWVKGPLQSGAERDAREHEVHKRREA